MKLTFKTIHAPTSDSAVSLISYWIPAPRTCILLWQDSAKSLPLDDHQGSQAFLDQGPRKQNVKGEYKGAHDNPQRCT